MTVTKRRKSLKQTAVRPLRLDAVLIVRNEEAVLADCLRSLRGVVDEIHVHDTGSTDATVEIATELGAKVTHGPWTDDFAAARNAALANVTATWVLSIDADERLVVADRRLLRQVLTTTKNDVLQMDIDNAAATPNGGHTHVAARFFRPGRVHWTGAVHERLVGRASPALLASLPRDLLRLHHLGYVAEETVRYKSERNTAVAQAMVDRLAAQGDAADPELVANTLIDLGRSQLGADQLNQAVETFETIRELFPGTPGWQKATDLLARALIDARELHGALILVEQLRASGVSGMYCDWLFAQALANMGKFRSARLLLDGITQLVDTFGVRRDPQILREAKDVLDARISGPALRNAA